MERRGLAVALALAAGAGMAACASGGGAGPAVPTGTREIEASAGGRSLPVGLELLSVADRPWGRLTVTVGVEVVVAVRGVARTGTAGTAGTTGVTWRFAVGGPVRDLELRFDGDGVVGTLVLGGAPPITLEGRRVGDVAPPEALRAHHVLEPLGLAGARAGEEGASYPVGTPGGALIFARHGPDLSRQTLVIAEATGDGWGDPRVLEVSGDHSDRSPALLPDGSGLVFASDRPTGDGPVDGYRLWVAPRVAPGEWGTPVPVELAGGWEHDARQPSVTSDGSLYFSSDAPGGAGDGDIYVAAPVGPGLWGPPRNLGPPINGPGDEHGAFVAPDGSYMILASAGAREGRSGGDDLYVSRPTSTGWSNPVPLALPVNTFANEYGAWVSPADHHLYFTSDRYGYARLFRLEEAWLAAPASGR